MMASRGASIRGSGTVSQRTSLRPCHTRAFIATSCKLLAEWSFRKEVPLARIFAGQPTAMVLQACAGPAQAPRPSSPAVAHRSPALIRRVAPFSACPEVRPELLKIERVEDAFFGYPALPRHKHAPPDIVDLLRRVRVRINAEQAP